MMYNYLLILLSNIAFNGCNIKFEMQNNIINIPMVPPVTKNIELILLNDVVRLTTVKTILPMV